MKTIVITILGAFCMLSPIHAKGKKEVIPFVSYQPYHFASHVKAQFRVDESCRYILKENGKLYLHDSGGCVQPQQQELKDEVLLAFAEQHDSTFIFSPTMSWMEVGGRIAATAKYYGYFNQGAICFYVPSKDKTYRSLEELIAGEYGSHAKFVARYVEDVKALCQNPLAGNELYGSLDDMQAAQRVLANDFLFPYSQDLAANAAKIGDAFVAFLSSRMVLNAVEKQHLQQLVAVQAKCMAAPKRFGDVCDVSFDKGVVGRPFTDGQQAMLDEMMAARVAMLRKAYDVLINWERTKMIQDYQFLSDQEEFQAIQKIVCK